jgi:hypothetical protein
MCRGQRTTLKGWFSICKTHETQEGKPKCGYFKPSYKWEQTPMEGVIETKCGVETEGMIIQRLPHLETHPINNHQNQILLWMPTIAC